MRAQIAAAPARRMRGAAALAGAGALAAVVSGCATAGGGLGTDVVTRVFQDQGYQASDVSQAAVGEAEIVIIDAPAGRAQAVADRLRLPGWFPRSRFKAVDGPGGKLEDGSIFLLKLNAGSGVTGAGLCQGRVSPGGPAGAAHIVLCNDGAVIAEGRLSSPRLADPTSAAAGDAFRGLFRLTFPSALRDREGPDRDRGGKKKR